MNKMDMSRILWCTALALSVIAAPPVTASPVGTAFTYQGQLDRNGSPANLACNFRFSLWDAATTGVQVGTTQTVNGISVADGLFTTTLDFGAGAFNGQARWLEIAVQGQGDPDFTTLAPRQVLSPAPYAMFALGGNTGFNLPYQQAVSSPGQTLFDLTNSAPSGLFHAISGKTASTTQNACGVYGEGTATSGYTSGVQGWALNSPGGTGVVGHGTSRGGWFKGYANDGVGIEGVGGTGGTGMLASGYWGLHAVGTSTGVRAESPAFAVHGLASGVGGRGVQGEHTATSGAEPGVLGFSATTSNDGVGTLGRCDAGKGVHGRSVSGQGVYGTSTTGQGVNGYSTQGDGVWGWSDAGFKSGVVGFSNNVSGMGGYFRNLANGYALVADGKAQVRLLEIIGGADLAEHFDVVDAVDPGTVVAIDPDHPGKLRAARTPYDRRVAGVVSGAGGIRTGMALRQDDSITDGQEQVALTGRVYVKCDAAYGPIAPGDLLTTSATPGHAMVADPARAGGAVLGKAMTVLEAGTGLVLVLVNLQ